MLAHIVHFMARGDAGRLQRVHLGPQLGSTVRQHADAVPPDAHAGSGNAAVRGTDRFTPAASDDSGFAPLLAQVHKSVYKIHSLHCAYDRCAILGSVKFQAAKGEDPLVQYIK